MTKSKNIAICIVLSLITCGIYGLIWMASLTNDINSELNEDGTSGGMCVLYSILTCGIYSFYWLYRIGEKTARLKAKTSGNTPDTSSPILFLVLGVFGLSLVVYALIQSEINRAVERGLS